MRCGRGARGSGPLLQLFCAALLELLLFCALNSRSIELQGSRPFPSIQLSTKFDRLNSDHTQNSSIPAWIITESNLSAVHRFFDSSPISPSGTYIALLLILGGENVRITELEVAEIVIYDLLLGPSSKKVIASTTAWDSQTGSHVQWGASDEALFYNIRVAEVATELHRVNMSKNANFASSKFMNLKCKGLRGVTHNIFTGISRMLDCPVYHVSPNGLFAVSPDLTKIGFTQLGYGVPSKFAKRNINAPNSDGVYLTNIRTGKCRLLSSLHNLAVVGGLDTKGTPTYGFHTKFSSDGKMIMFVVRTLHERSINFDDTVSSIEDKVFGTISSAFGYLQKSSYRTQHLFVILLNCSDIRLILSWGGNYASRSNILGNNSSTTHGPSIRGIFDGNHPNWIVNTHNISMNLVEIKKSKENYGIHRWMNKKSLKQQMLRYQAVTINVDAILTSSSSSSSSSQSHKSGALIRHHVDIEPPNEFQIEIAYPWGTGHPSYHPGGRYLLMDTYPKEIEGLRALVTSTLSAAEMNHTGTHSQRMRLDHGYVPLRLVDTVTGKEIWLAKVCSVDHLHNLTQVVPMSKLQYCAIHNVMNFYQYIVLIKSIFYTRFRLNVHWICLRTVPTRLAKRKMPGGATPIVCSAGMAIGFRSMEGHQGGTGRFSLLI